MTRPILTDARQEALGFLYSRINYERVSDVPYRPEQFKLQRMRQLLAGLGQPHQQLNIVHIAGTKGKGSTAAMAAAVLGAAGYRTGLYTSPHLYRVEERAVVDGQPCSAEELVELVEQIRPVVEQMDRAAHRRGQSRGPTFFEITTALALLHFARRQVDFAVLEVGLGGRLDSTNVCWPRVSVITSISFDHTRQLGNTLGAIAREKAGIIKPGVPVVSGVRAAEPAAVIAAVARERGSPLWQIGRHFDYAYELQRDGTVSPVARGKLHYHERGGGPAHVLADLPLGLIGRHQAANAAVTLAALGCLRRQGWNISDAAIRTGLADVRFPARVEVVGREPTVVIDAAHNVASIEALVAALEAHFVADRKIMIFATSQDKDAEGMLQRLLPCFDHIVLTRYVNNPRHVMPDELLQVARRLAGQPGGPKALEGRVTVCDDPATAWARARALAHPADLICVAGSSFIAGEIRPLAVPGTALQVAG